MYARRVRRMIRRIDPWSALKVSLIFNLCLTTVALTAGVVMYNLARLGGFMARIEGYMEGLGFENFRFVGTRTLMAAILLLSVFAIFVTAATVLMSFIYNLIAEVVGGIEVSTLDEVVDVIEAPVIDDRGRGEERARLRGDEASAAKEVSQDSRGKEKAASEAAVAKK